MRQILHGYIIDVPASVSHCIFRRHSHFPAYLVMQAVVDSSRDFAIQQPPIVQIRSRNKRSRTASSEKMQVEGRRYQKGKQKAKIIPKTVG